MQENSLTDATIPMPIMPLIFGHKKQRNTNLNHLNDHLQLFHLINQLLDMPIESEIAKKEQLAIFSDLIIWINQAINKNKKDFDQLLNKLDSSIYDLIQSTTTLSQFHIVTYQLRQIIGDH